MGVTAQSYGGITKDQHAGIDHTGAMIKNNTIEDVDIMDGIKITGADVDTLDEYEAIDLHLPLTVTEFRANAATGTASTPERLNDNDTTACASYNSTGNYVEINFGKMRKVTEFRYFGNASHNQDGDYKIQYLRGSMWVDAHTGISTRLDSWSAWMAINNPFITNKVRVVATTMDSYGYNQPNEWEMRG